MRNQRSIVAGFIMSLIFLSAIAYLSHSFFVEYTIRDREESYAFNVVVKLDDLLRSLREENTAQRKYLSSNNQTDLDLYANASRKVSRELAKLHALIAGNRMFEQQLAGIDPLIHAQQMALEESIETGVRNENLRNLFRDVLDRILEVRSHALAEMRKSSAVLQKHLKKVQLMLMLNSLIVAFLFSTIFWLFKKDITRRITEEAELKQHRDMLDELVLHRTAELVTANQRLNTEMEVRKQAEKSLHSLNHHMEEIREEERLAISRDIHDEIGQALTALKLDVVVMEHMLTPENPEFLIRVKGMKSSIDSVIGKVQNIMSELRPPLFDSLGLNEAIKWQISEFKHRNRVECSLEFGPGECEIDKKSATALMRILMEALTNISRHAQATKVNVFLGLRDAFIELEVRDNGRGITSEEMASPSAYGLMGMQERARLCNGTLTVTGLPGQGTTICLRLPTQQHGELS